jgi:hypothetical protein
VERDGRTRSRASVVSGGGVGTVLTRGGILGVRVGPSWTLDTAESLSSFPFHTLLLTQHSLLSIEHEVGPLGTPLESGWLRRGQGSWKR